MITAYIIFMIVLIIVLCTREENMKDIINTNLQGMISQKRESFKSYRAVFCIFGVLLAVGIILYTCTELHKTVQIHTFLGDRMRRKWTASHYWALILTFFGSIGTIVGLVGTLRQYASYSRYRNMSQEDYQSLQARTQIKYDEEQKESEEYVKRYQRHQALGIIRGLLGF